MYWIGKVSYNTYQLVQKCMNRYLQALYYKRMGKIGKGVRFNGISKITGFKNIEIGDNVHIGTNAFIRGEGGLYIGDNTHISRNLVLYTHNHNYEGELLPYDATRKYRNVIIEDNVWIGMNVVILPGAHIKEGSIIGAGSVVAGSYDALGIYGAPKAAMIKERNREHYYRLKEDKKFGGVSGRPLSN